MTNKPFIKIVMAAIVLAEILSALGYFLPRFNQVGFFLIFGLAVLLSLSRLEYGVYLALGELFIGSMGKIFFLEIGGLSISIRVAIWVAVMSVWLGGVIAGYLKDKKVRIALLDSNHWPYYLTFALFIIWGGLSGIWNKNEFSNIFFDFNGWLYFSYVFPWYEVLASTRKNEVLRNIFNIFFAACVWLSFKTLFLLYLFSHKTVVSTFGLYYWMRKNQLGEITQMKSDFFRIFIQSQIYILTGIFLSLAYALKNSFNRRKLVFFLSALISVILISFSRSFWVGGVCAILSLIIFCFMAYRGAWREYAKLLSVCLSALAISLVLIVSVVKFPWPGEGAGQNAISLLTERAGQVSGEDGASSRWSLLPALWDRIKLAPLTGLGWGTTVTYKSSDPRVLEANPTGQYTTFAFEWGWLDIWLKLGLLGLISYLALSLVILKDCWSAIDKDLKNNWLYAGLMMGVIAIFAVSFFSPYTNHPLGIGFLILTGAIVSGKSRL